VSTTTRGTGAGTPMRDGIPTPEALSSASDFVDALRYLRTWSGLTFRKLSAKATASGDALPTSTIATMLGRSTLPRREVVAAFTRACGLDEHTVARWVAARDGLALPAASRAWAVEIDRPSPTPTDTPMDTGSAGARTDGAAWPVPAMLPPAIADFTGRSSESAALFGALVPTDGPPPSALAIAGIVGMGGTGKTTLAVHVAHRLAAAYSAGQLCVNLAGTEPAALDPGEVLARFLRALGVADRAIPKTTVERADLFRTRVAGRRVLVVLDNAASEEQVRPLLPGAGSCAVLLTSRTRLSGLEAVHWTTLDGFSPAESIQLLAQVAGDRVVADVDQAARIAQLCGDLPLAMRIAGARLAARPEWQLAHLAAMLDDERGRLDQLATGDLAVRASLRLSYEALDAPERRLFRLLGLFDAPDFAAWLAGAVLHCPVYEASEHVEALVDAQLLTVVPTDQAGQLRYRFHDLVRLFANECAHAEESESERQRVIGLGLGTWLLLAERMSARIPGPCYAPLHGAAPRPALEWIDGYSDSVDPQDWFDAERVALAHAVRQACRHDLDDLAFDLAGCMEKYFDLRGKYAEWRALNTAALMVCRRNGNRLGEAAMRRGLLDVTTWIDDDQSADRMAYLLAEGRQLLELFTELGHDPGASDTAVMCAWALAARGDTAEAVAMVSLALELAERSEHLGGQVRARLALAVAHHEQRQFAEAVDQASIALDKARLLGNPRAEATALQFLGIGQRDAGEFEIGERMLEQSVAICRQYRDHYTEALSILALARLYLNSGDPRVRPTAETSLTLSREYHMSHHIADSLTILGEIELAGGRHEQAAEHLEESVAIWRTRGWHSFHAAALVCLGRAQAPTDTSAAQRSFTEAFDLYTRLGRTTAASEAAQLAALAQHAAQR
jgi:tetratricopeptide (TPR) repeat protein